MSAKNGLVAGLCATIVLSILMVIKDIMVIMPQVNVIVLLTHIGAEYIGLPLMPMFGWIEHGVVGIALWGLIFAATAELWPTPSYFIKGVTFSMVAWLLMMITVMPLADAGLFGMGIGVEAPVMTLILHLIFYGAVLGFVAGRLPRGEE